MIRKIMLVLCFLLIAQMVTAQTHKQTPRAHARKPHVRAAATAHGVKVVWTAATTPGGSGTIASYNIYRCAGSCTATSGAFALLTGQVATVPLNYLDQSALVAGNTYTYTVTAIDSASNESAYGAMASVVFSVISNPNPPATLTVTVQ